MKVIPAPAQARGNAGILCKKTVARMNRVAASAFNDIHNFVDAQITFARRRRADRVGFTGQAHMQGVAVGFAEHHGRWNAKFAAGAQDAHGDFAAIGN